MSNLEYKFSNPSFDPDEPTKKHVFENLSTNEALYRQRIVDDMGILAVAAVIGIAGPEQKDTPPFQASREQKRKLGNFPVRTMVAVNHPSFMNRLEIDQSTAVNEQAMLGYANRSEYGLAV